MVNLIERYKERYSISYLDLADSAETNRLHILFATPFLFIIGVIDLIVIFTIHRNNLQDYITSIIYFGNFTIVSALTHVYSKCIKNVEREKSYILKTVPFYVVLYLGIFSAIYNFYILDQPFNGVITFLITNLISISAFTFSPIFFFIAIVIGLGFLIPGVFKNFGVTGLMDTVLSVILIHGFSLYKRFTTKRLILNFKKQKQSLVAKTFGNFTLLYDNKAISFRRTQSTELIAYLIYKNGSSVRTKELISVLWGDKADSARYGSSLRNLIIDIKHTLAKLEIQNFFIADYNNFRINPEAVQCDYYDFLHNDKNSAKNFAGEFMSQYSWAEEAAGFIERKILAEGK